MCTIKGKRSKRRRRRRRKEENCLTWEHTPNA
jgi:hypothetical protein